MATPDNSRDVEAQREGQRRNIARLSDFSQLTIASRRRSSHFAIVGDGRNKTREKKRREGTLFSYWLSICPCLLGSPEAAEYGDTSAIYWKLYVSEAEENDQKLVDSLSGDTNSMLILVRGNA